MDDHVLNPLLSPLILGFSTGRFVGVCRGLYREYFPQLVGNSNFQKCKSPPQPVPGVVGHYIDRCIKIYTCESFVVIVL